jgi:hypothetical protein
MTVTRTARPATKKAAPARKSLTPLQKKKLRTFNAPDDLKAKFIVVKLRTAQDGILNDVQVEACQGKLDNEKALRANLAELDLVSYTRLIARMSAAWYATNPLRRPPPKSAFRLTFRVARRGTGQLMARMTEAAQLVKNERTGKTAFKVFADKADPTYRVLRKCVPILSGFATELKNIERPTRASLKAAAEKEEGAVEKAPVRKAAKKPVAKKPVVKALPAKKPRR